MIKIIKKNRFVCYCEVTDVCSNTTLDVTYVFKYFIFYSRVFIYFLFLHTQKRGGGEGGGKWFSQMG